jgi:PAS domain S-box-containing protein
MPKPAFKKKHSRSASRRPARARPPVAKHDKDHETIFHSVPALIWYKDRNNIILKANRPAAESMGLTVQEIEGRSTYDLYPHHEAAKYHRDDLEVIESGRPKLGIIEPYTTTSGEKLWMKTDKIPYLDESGQIVGVLVMAIDITKVKRAEEEIKVALKEKELLLKEVHHRVKNNLQVISSLFDLQADELNDEKLRGILRKNQQRVRAISLVHDLLYQSRELSRIDFGEYVSNLMHFLIQMHEISPDRIRTGIKVEDIYLDINTAIPCGLIINEVVTNSLKHAFPEGRSGEIRISFERLQDENEYHLRISDDGCGLRSSERTLNGKSLGLEIVRALAKQLGAEVVVRSEAGVIFELKFRSGHAPLERGVDHA